jgi:PAS domain S-box-containing protein
MPPPSEAITQPAFSGSWNDFRTLVESVVDEAAFMLDAEGRIVSWGARAEKVVGYTASEIVGEHFAKLAPPEDAASPKRAQELAIAADLGRFEHEAWRVRKDGGRFWAAVAITALHDDRGKVAAFAIVLRDLTAKEAAATQLRGTHQDFHHLVDAITDYAVFMLDPSGNVATWNPGAAKAKGYRAEEILGKSFSVFYTAEDREAGKPDRVLQTVRQEGRFAEEGWRVRKDGTRFWAGVVVTALRDDQGKLIGFAKVTRDLTERRSALEQLRRSEERFRLLVENVADYAIYMLDEAGRVVTWNLGAERMKGYTASEVIGRNFECFFPESDVATGKPARELAGAKAEGRFEDEGWRVRKDGSRFWANALLTALHDAAGNLVGFAKITRDLTARRESEEKDRQLLHEQIAREMAEKSQAELRASEERYRALGKRLEIVLEGVADGITVQDASGLLVFANTAAA